MRSIDLLCPCETTSKSADLNESTDATFVESVNATLKEVANSINASNADSKDALNKLGKLGKDTQIENPQEESEE